MQFIGVPGQSFGRSPLDWGFHGATPISGLFHGKSQAKLDDLGLPPGTFHLCWVVCSSQEKKQNGKTMLCIVLRSRKFLYLKIVMLFSSVWN